MIDENLIALTGPALDADVEALLAAERDIPTAPTESRQRVAARVALTIGIVGGALSSGARTEAAEPPPVTPHAPVVGRLGSLGRLGLGLAAATVAAVALYVGIGLGRSPGSATFVHPTTPPAVLAPASAIANAPPSLVDQPGPTSPLPVPSAAPDAPAVDPKAAAHRARPGSANALGAPTEEAGGLDAERSLLDTAQAALARNDIHASDAALAQHARRFPSGQLAEERESLAVRALAVSGRGDEAHARAAAFRQRFPESMYLPAVEASIEMLH